MYAFPVKFMVMRNLSVILPFRRMVIVFIFIHWYNPFFIMFPLILMYLFYSFSQSLFIKYKIVVLFSGLFYEIEAKYHYPLKYLVHF